MVNSTTPNFTRILLREPMLIVTEHTHTSQSKTSPELYMASQWLTCTACMLTMQLYSC